MKKLTYLPAFAIAMVMFSGCSYFQSDDTMTIMEDDAMVMVDDDSDEGELDPGDAMESADVLVELFAEPFTYGEDEVLLEQDSTVTIRVKNVSGTHDFVIDELDIDTGLIPEGEFVDVVIPTDQVGEFTYYCSVGNHRAQGMEGTIVIQ